MSGVLYGRAPNAQNTGPIHLWEHESTSKLQSSCGEYTCEVDADTQTAETRINVEQKEAFKTVSDAYCEDCVRNNPHAGTNQKGR